MGRKEIISEPAYWLSKVQTELFRLANKFMKDHKMNRKGFASHLGVTPGYVTQLLNGDYDYRLSHVAELAIALGYVPVVNFIPIEEMEIRDESRSAVIVINPEIASVSPSSDKVINITKAA